jgi:hypothetical protein
VYEEEDKSYFNNSSMLISMPSQMELTHQGIPVQHLSKLAPNKVLTVGKQFAISS